MNHLKLVTKEYPAQSLPSIHRRAAYAAALLLVADIDEGLTSGRSHYRSRAGRLLTSLDEIVRAIIADDLMVASPALELAEAA